MDAREIANGFAFTAAGHIAIPVLIALWINVSTAIFGPDVPKKDNQERNVIAATFVKLGKEFDPRRLPNRQVPQLTTAPLDEKVVSKNPQPNQIIDAGMRSLKAEHDDLVRLGDRAQAFAQKAAQEREGNPEGVAEGTADTARAGDIYAGKLQNFIRQGWSVPTLITDEELRHLAVEIDFVMSRDCRVKRFAILKSSGNPVFDQSAVARLQELKDANTELPCPPPEVKDLYLNQTVGFRFRGRDVR